jgi:hypothetical protein
MVSLKPETWENLFGCSFAALLVFGVSLLIWWFGIRTTPIVGCVVRHQWTNSTDVEEYVTKRVVGVDSVPGGGRTVASREETRLTTKYTYKKGLQLTTKQVTVYDYDYDQWCVVRTASIAGVGTSATAWPDLSSLHTGTDVGCQRPGQRSGSRTLIIRMDGSEVAFAPNTQFWAAVNDGETVLIQLSSGGSIKTVDRVEQDH